MARAICSIPLAKWENNKLHVELPENIDKQSPTMTLIYDENGQLLWAQRDVPRLMKMIQPDWLKSNGFHEIEADVNDTSLLLSGDHSIQQQLQEVREDDDDAEMTHSVAVNVYPATSRMPKLTIVVVDTIPVELKKFLYGLELVYLCALSQSAVSDPAAVGRRLVEFTPPSKPSAKEVRELEEHNRELLNPATTRELTSLVRNLNRLLKSERERYDKYRTTLTDLTHSLKTPLAVLQSTLRSLRSEKMSVSDAEPVMLEQISRISQQIGYYLHRASMRGGTLLSRELHPVAPLLDNLTSALNKVYQRKGVNISLDISPEISFVGEQNDFVEVMGNVLDNACKYCLEFVEISARQTDEHLYIVVEDDGPGIPLSKREVIFDRGQRVDTLRPGQGVGLAVAREITEQYEGKIVAGESMLGGARMEVIFWSPAFCAER